MKDGMIIYASYVEKFKKLSNEQFGRLVRLILQYQKDGVVPEIEDLAISIAFDIMKIDLDKNNERYEEICEQRRIAGAKGGLAKASKRKQMIANDSKSYQEVANDSKTYQSLANLADKDKDKEEDKEEDKDKDILLKENVESKAKRFTPPTVTEVSDYCRENNYNIDAQRFVDFYESKGWMVGKNKMKDWKAAVRNWVRRQKEDNSSEKSLDEKTQKRYAKYDEWHRRGLGEVDENTLKRREKYAELEEYYLGEE